jgi:predicted nuclease of predicted toxin-antitoxin system
MLFHLDECIPDSTREMLFGLGHEAFRITNFVTEGSPDPLVARVAEDAGAVLVSHDRDFKRYSMRRMDGQAPRFPTLCVIHMQCKPTRIVERLRTCLPLIELEYAARQTMHDRRVIVEIKTDFVVIHR